MHIINQKGNKASKSNKEASKPVEPVVKSEHVPEIKDEPETAVKPTEEPEVFESEPLPMDTIAAQTPSPAPTGQIFVFSKFNLGFNCS